ncbi:MAG: segregation/condensation protein A [Tissierellia bacterium]|nr:segregation/condensation protein A [Tissierellia bacterium]
MLESLNIDVEKYQGPLDLLLNLIEKSKIDIYDIEISQITNDYISTVREMDIDISQFSKFIYISSILLAIKSKSLLPKDDDLEVSKEDLITTLIEYKRIKSVKDELELMEENALKYHSKIKEDLTAFKKEPEIQIDKDIDLLKNEFVKLLAKLNKTKEDEIDVIITQKDLDVNEYMIKILGKLDNGKIILNDITNEIKTKKECIVVFLALLELTRIQEIYLLENDRNNLEVIRR